MAAQHKYYADNTANEMADEIAWRNFRAGDIAAFEWIFKKYNPILTHYGVKFFYDLDVVQDCIQELFLHLWNKRESLPEVKAIKYYLITALRRSLLKNVVLLRREAVVNNALGNEPHNNESSHEKKLIDELSLEQTADRLTLAMQTLPPRQREAVYLKFYEEKSYAEITSIMSINYQTARKFIYKGLQVIRRSLTSDPRFSK